MRGAVHAVDPDQPVANIRRMSQFINISVCRFRRRKKFTTKITNGEQKTQKLSCVFCSPFVIFVVNFRNPHSNHSRRSATIGCTFVARRAGA
jgi:hypothetical protein